MRLHLDNRLKSARFDNQSLEDFCSSTGGKCQAIPPWNNATECICNEGFFGPSCNYTVDPCDGVDCHNGSCVSQDVMAICECEDGYDGEFCENKINCNTVGCQNDGNCVEGVCNCTNQYEGEFCDEKSPCHEDISDCNLIGGQCVVNGNNYTCEVLISI